MADYLISHHFVLTISLDPMKSSEVRKAGDQSNYYNKNTCNDVLLFAVLSLTAYDGLRPGYSPEQSKSSF